MDAEPNIQLFTFRTFPKELLAEHLPNVHVAVMHGLKRDLTRIQTASNTTDETVFIGFALSKSTRQEPVAINRFNNGTIDRSGPNVVELALFDTLTVPVAQNPTWSFCNYTAYVLAQNYRVHFIHTTRDDFMAIADYIKRYLLNTNQRERILATL